MVWDILGVAAFVLASTTVWMVASTIRQLGKREPSAVPPMLRRALLIREIPAETLAAFAKERPGSERIAFIANPTKAGVAEVREAAYRACSMRYLPEPVWLYTTPHESGTVLAREAIEAGADVLVAVGGDGTVRAVAEAAIEKGVPLGIIPTGTGNLLARNLDIPANDFSAAIRTAIDGMDSKVDVGWISVGNEEGEEQDHLFLVFAGIGIDADMVAGADDKLKSTLGWGAYFFAALPFMGAKRMRASVSVDGSEPVIGQMRSVVAANCGRLPGGMTLMPDARINDGALDFATIDTRAGIAGWAELFSEVWIQGAGLTAPNLPKAWRAGRIDHARGTSVDIRVEAPQRVQADGESLGRASHVRARIDPGVLTVRTLVEPKSTRR
jgi:diacylglycerol kinase (ATP)